MPLFFQRKKYREINPDEIFLDSENIPGYDKSQFEGRLEKPINKVSLYLVIGFFGLIITVFLVQTWKLQIVNGETYARRSERNMIRPIPIFAARGTISDRNGILLTWNSPGHEGEKGIESLEQSFAHREYATTSGMAHILGYVRYPSKDVNGFYYREDFEGVDGVEEYFSDKLKGSNGSKLVEVDALGNIISEGTIRPVKTGDDLVLSVDSRLQTELFANIKKIAESVGFEGGAGIIMDIHSGEILAMTSYPEYSPQMMSDNKDTVAINNALKDPSLPFLDRAVDGLYVPGSILKPYLALGALNEKLIDPEKEINNTGSISIPNPYDPTKATIFRDWKAMGWIDMYDAIAMSSDVYFYMIGGGYKDQSGLGISLINKYFRMFGFGSSLDDPFFGKKTGTVPTPEWKKKTFDEDWYLGNTYHTAIGQYGMQVTPMQVIKAISALANGGLLIKPQIIKTDSPKIEGTINIQKEYFDIIRQGMRQGVVEGTGKALDVPYVKIATKTGTAELGVTKEKVNSWITGFWPYDDPKYTFTVIMEKGSVHNLIGGAAVMRAQFDWMAENTPEYLK